MDSFYKFCTCIFLACSLAVTCLGQFENMGMLALAGGFGGRGMGGGMGMGAGGMGMGLGMGMGGMTPTEYAVLENAVKTIVGQHASPDPAIIAHATQQGAIPRNMFQMMGYVPFLQNIARTVGLQPTPGQTTTGNQAQNTDSIVMQRAIQWMQANGMTLLPMNPMF